MHNLSANAEEAGDVDVDVLLAKALPVPLGSPTRFPWAGALDFVSAIPDVHLEENISILIIMSQ